MFSLPAFEASTPRTWMESVDLMRIGRAEIEANPAGIALGGAVLEALAMAGQVTRAKVADPKSSSYKMGADKYQTMFDWTLSYLWISTLANTRADQIAAGRAYVRMNLAATTRGIAVHPVSQALQESPEMARELDGLHCRLGIAAPALRHSQPIFSATPLLIVPAPDRQALLLCDRPGTRLYGYE